MGTHKILQILQIIILVGDTLRQISFVQFIAQRLDCFCVAFIDHHVILIDTVFIFHKCTTEIILKNINTPVLSIQIYDTRTGTLVITINLLKQRLPVGIRKLRSECTVSAIPEDNLFIFVNHITLIIYCIVPKIVLEVFLSIFISGIKTKTLLVI